MRCTVRDNRISSESLEAVPTHQLIVPSALLAPATKIHTLRPLTY